jgi:hypothetical protein
LLRFLPIFREKKLVFFLKNQCYDHFYLKKQLFFAIFWRKCVFFNNYICLNRQSFMVWLNLEGICDKIFLKIITLFPERLAVERRLPQGSRLGLLADPVLAMQAGRHRARRRNLLAGVFRPHVPEV